MKPHPVPREDRAGTICEDYELNGCSVDGCPERCYLALPNPNEPMTAAEFVFVSALCQFYNPYPGPIAWLCRYAWIAYQTLGADTDIEIDNVIARQADWLNKPENTTTRTNLINCIRWLRHMAAKPPLWPLPPRRFEIDHVYIDQSEGWYDAGTLDPGDGPTLTASTYLPPDPEPEPPREPARWDGRPIPGKCTIDGCPYQATSMYGYWDGGAPGQGTWRQQGRCPQHTTGHELAQLRTELEP